MLAFVLLAVLQNSVPAAANDAFAPLRVYDGRWTVHAQHSFSGGSGLDSLVNHCHGDQAFFTCEQVVNGKPAALMVFVPGKEPGKFDVDSITPNGHASSDTDLFVKGEHWTFVTNNDAGKPTFRVENTFHGRDAIHFEMFSTGDGGATWTKVNEGDTLRDK